MICLHALVMSHHIAQTDLLQPSAPTAALHLCTWLVCAPAHVLSFTTTVPVPAPSFPLVVVGTGTGLSLASHSDPELFMAEDSKDISARQHEQVFLHENQGRLAPAGSSHGLCNRQFVSLAWPTTVASLRGSTLCSTHYQTTSPVFDSVSGQAVLFCLQLFPG